MKAFLQYLVLIGVPLLGLLAVLHYGNRLQAPIFIGGTWVIDPPDLEIPQPVCTPFGFATGRQEMTFSQSGRYVEVRFDDPDSHAAGKLDGLTLIAEGRTSGSAMDGTCPEQTAVEVQLHFESGIEASDGFVGQWILADCESCPPLSFTGERLIAE